MSTSFEKIFTNTTILKAYVLEINGSVILNEDIISFELMFDMDKPFIEGTVILKDTFGFADLNVFDGNTVIKLYANDIYDEKFLRTFRVINIQNDEYNERFKKYTLSIVDEMYYKLVNTYLSKSYTGNPVTALEEYLTELELDTYMSDNKITKNFDSFSGDDYSFVVPQDRSVYDFFNYEFQNQGLRFWQGRKSLNVKELTINSLEYQQDDEGNNLNYTNDTTNPLYGFRVHDFKTRYNAILNSNIRKPIIEHYAYNPSSKSMDTTTKNLSDIYSDLELNTQDMSGLQHTTGQKYQVDAEVYIGKQKVELEDVYMKNNTLEIVVPGNYKYNDIGQLIKVSLKGNPLMSKSDTEGDTFHSGNFLIQKINDRYVGDKLVQKMTLHRIDFQEVRNR